MRLFGGRLYESVRLSREDKLTDPESPEHPPVLRRINPAGVQPTFVAAVARRPRVCARRDTRSARLPAPWSRRGSAVGSGRPGFARARRLGAGRSHRGALRGRSLESGARPRRTAARRTRSRETWSARSPPSPAAKARGWRWTLRSDASNPSPTAPALVARVSANGTVSDEQTLPSAEETQAGVGPKGAAKKIACPAPHDCWMVTTQGWLFHLSARSDAPARRHRSRRLQSLITYRPPDEGLPQVAPDAPPIDDSGLAEGPPAPAGTLAEESAPAKSTVTAPLLSHVHTRIVHRDMLELRFHLAVKARVRLLARRRTQRRGEHADAHAGGGDSPPAAAPRSRDTGRPSLTCRPMRSRPCRRSPGAALAARDRAPDRARAAAAGPNAVATSLAFPSALADPGSGLAP